ncbi:MAG: type II toxin-antitoxin system HicA family toxin [Acidobacteria bacterium]|nr:type II toxin-antitoxin system HicA family toxin [Acidobacteriota bacterium]
MRLPSDLSGRELWRALERAGFVFQRQSGSHIILKRGDPPCRVVVPDHKVLRQGTLRQILHDAGLSVSELLDLLR